jgi:hypothetical protein
MLKNIILEITSDKKARNIEPTHATYKEVYSICQKQGFSATSIKSGLNELYLAGEIEVGDTLNDKYIKIK